MELNMAYKYPNVISNTKNTSYDNPPVDIDVHEDIQPFIDALAVKYPHWEFVADAVRYTGTNNEIRKAIKFKVHNDANPREPIGEVLCSHKINNDGKRVVSYVVFNQRLSQDRERGYKLETIKLPVAMKAVHKYFNPPPIVEVLEHVMDRGEGQYRNAVAFKRRAAENTEFHLEKSQQEFLRNNWAAYKASVNPLTLELVEKYEQQLDEYVRMEQIKSENNFVAVVIQNDKYMVHCKGKVDTYDVNTIPIALRAQLGLLKLVDEGDVLEGVGIRMREGFLVFLPKEEEDEVS